MGQALMGPDGPNAPGCDGLGPNVPLDPTGLGTNGTTMGPEGWAPMGWTRMGPPEPSWGEPYLARP